jgi:hypothetical protein
MRKYLIGFIAGILLASVAPAYGAVSSLIGKSVQGEYTVKVDGAILSKKSVSIDGTTYAPLRAIGEATGYDVDFVNNEVVFTKKEESPLAQASIRDQEYSLDYIDSMIKTLNHQKEYAQKMADSFGNDPQAEAFRNAVKDAEAQLKVWQNRKSEYGANNP